MAEVKGRQFPRDRFFIMHGNQQNVQPGGVQGIVIPFLSRESAEKSAASCRNGGTSQFRAVSDLADTRVP